MRTEDHALRRTAAVIVLFTFLSPTVYSAVIMLTSQTHHISGLATGTAESDSFDVVSSSPVSRSAAAPWWDGAFSPDNPVTNQVFAAAGHYEVAARDDSGWTFTGSRAFADSSYTFRPLYDSFGLRMTGQVEMHAFENEIGFSLFDVTNGVEIESRSWSNEEPETLYVNWFEQFSVNTAYEYRLDLHAHVYPGDTPGVTSILAASFVIPEPGTLILLGLGSAVALYRKNDLV